MRNVARNALREPLLHFAVIAAAIFAAWSWVGGGADGGADAPGVRIAAAQVDWLQQGFERQWRRPPTPEETRGLVADLVREQLLAREARVLGLDVDDTVVRRRLAQKMRFVVEDTLDLAEPTADELRRFYELSAAQFAAPARRSFEHLYFSGHRRGDAAVADARAALPLAARDPVAAGRLADATLLESPVAAVDEAALAARFGSGFAGAVFALPVGEWHGPLESGFGYHLVRVTDVAPGRRPDFASARAQLLERWRDAQQRAAMHRYFAGLLAKYPVAVDESVRALIGASDAAQLVATSAAETAAPR